jgi:hypothetical protein
VADTLVSSVRYRVEPRTLARFMITVRRLPHSGLNGNPMVESYKKSGGIITSAMLVVQKGAKCLSAISLMSWS